MLRSRVSALFVFDADNALVGVVSEGDLLRRGELGTERKRPHWLELLLGSGRLAEAYAHEHGRKAGEVMTGNVEPIAEDAELSEAVDRMIHRASSGCRYCGETPSSASSRAPTSSRDCWPRRHARDAHHPDAEIKAAIQAELDKLGWAPSASVRVEVANGAVTYSGRDHRPAAARGAQGDRRECAGRHRCA